MSEMTTASMKIHGRTLFIPSTKDPNHRWQITDAELSKLLDVVHWHGRTGETPVEVVNRLAKETR